MRDYVKVLRPGRAGMMGRAKLFRWTERLMGAPDLEAAAHVLRRLARTAPMPVLVPGRPYKPALSWRWMLRKTARGLSLREPFLKPIMEGGNMKLPFFCWSTLPVFTCPGAGDCANWCYSLTAWRVAGPWCRQAQNTLLLKFDRPLVERSFHAIPDGGVFRLYVDGDFDSVDTFDFWMRLLRERQSVRAYGYSKSWDVIWDWWHEVGKHWAEGVRNYRLNLSSGGRPQRVTREEMLSLPFVRGEFLTLPVDYHQADRSHLDSRRYHDPKYHKAVRDSGTRLGLKVFSCPGQCGTCCGAQHACGSDKFKGVTIAIGQH
jgi:hypothetical protein